MFDYEWVSDLGGGDACEAVALAHRDLLEVETRLLVLAGQWLDLHGRCEEPDADGPGRVLPGTGRFVRVGAAGTPEVDEFACAEFAALQGMHPLAGANRLRLVANLRHRHPELWGRVQAGQVRGWKALEVARVVGKAEYGLSAEQARWVDAQTCAWIDTLPWGQFLDLLEAKVIACDPEAAEARRRQAEADRFVATGKSNEYGLTTLIAKATGGDVIYFAAMCDRIAQILALHGDTDPVGARRSKAIGILATPLRAHALLEAAERAAAADHPDTGPQAGSDEDSAGGSDAGEDGDESPDPDLDHREDPENVQPGDLHPSQDDSDDPEDPEDADDPAPAPRPCPTCDGTGTTTLAGDPVPFRKPARIDPRRLLPRAVVYVHLSREGFETGRGVARVEGVGPVTLGQAKEFVGHTAVKVVPVLDLADRRPVDGYEFPATSREAVHLINPRDVFPFAASTSRRVDLDHPVPYVSPDDGGPPGQTNLGNAAPMIRFHHRLKTHGRWRLRQPEPGTYLWRSPHGWYWLVDHTGSHPLTRHLGDLLWDALRQNAA
ncbi:MAG TPA: hypothetical protein VFG68_08320 [Fimbriiglobus sp.]|nr:hypothetical protein [Fimbriiglobus sp.]